MYWKKITEPMIVKPPFFETPEAANTRRMEFDLKNGEIIENDIPVDVVFIGDSITHFWDLNIYFRSFGLVLNRGIGGDRADIIPLRFEGDVLQLKPRVCVMMAGINNTWDIEAKGTHPEEIFNTVTTGYEDIMEMLRGQNIKMLFASVLPVRDFSEGGKVRNRLVRRLNDNIQELCREYGATYVDYYSEMVDENGLMLREGMAISDGLHPHAAGYNVMANVLTPFLEQALK